MVVRLSTSAGQYEFKIHRPLMPRFFSGFLRGRFNLTVNLSNTQSIGLGLNRFFIVACPDHRIGHLYEVHPVQGTTNPESLTVKELYNSYSRERKRLNHTGSFLSVWQCYLWLSQSWEYLVVRSLSASFFWRTSLPFLVFPFSMSSSQMII